MTNSITALKNETRSLQLLAAQRQLYSSAKRLMGWQLILGGPVATLAVVLGILMPTAKAPVALWGLTVLLLDTVWLTPRQKRLREAGAKVQERFDCDVLGMRWDTMRVGNPEPAELVLEQATRYNSRAPKMTPLTDWYPCAIERLPLPLARLVCQRTNCWWDSKQRRSYASVLAGALMLGLIAALVAGLAARLQVSDLILVVIVPMLSSIKLAHQQWTEQRDAADRLDRLRERLERIWKDALAAPTDSRLECESRALQGEIFDGRKRNPPVFDFVFRRLRDSHEAQMNFGAEQLVVEAGDVARKNAIK